MGRLFAVGIGNRKPATMVDAVCEGSRGIAAYCKGEEA